MKHENMSGLAHILKEKTKLSTLNIIRQTNNFIYGLKEHIDIWYHMLATYTYKCNAIVIVCLYSKLTKFEAIYFSLIYCHNLVAFKYVRAAKWNTKVMNKTSDTKYVFMMRQYMMHLLSYQFIKLYSSLVSYFTLLFK